MAAGSDGLLGLGRANGHTRSRVDSDARTVRGRHPTRAMPCRKTPDGGGYGSVSEGSGSAVSVPRGKAPATNGEPRYPFQPSPPPSRRWEVHGLPTGCMF